MCVVFGVQSAAKDVGGPFKGLFGSGKGKVNEAKGNLKVGRHMAKHDCRW